MRLRALLLIAHEQHLPEMDLSRSPRVSGGRGWGPEENRDRQICFPPRGKQKKCLSLLCFSDEKRSGSSTS